MSGSKRTILIRRPRRPTYDQATLELFVRLEATPASRRRSAGFEKQDYELHRLLGLSDERLCSQVSVLDRSSGPCHPPGYVAHDDWYRVRAVREALLEAAGLESRTRTAVGVIAASRPGSRH